MNPADVVFSLRRIYIDGLLSGSKCVELRRRVPALKNGTKVWFYSKAPDGELLGVGVLAEVKADHPANLWKKYSLCSGLNEDEFFSYFTGVEQGAALIFDSVAKLRCPIPLSDLKRLEANFHPPQFFRHIRSLPLKSLLREAETELASNPCHH